jgi:hypothetical protein
MRPARLVDPRDPRAPSREAWDRLTESERAEVVASLPSEIERAAPPEGDAHFRPKKSAFDALDEHYRRIRRKMYLAAELPVYYPDEPMFAPDLLAVRDADDHARPSWVVSHEQRGIDVALEIHVAGDRRKDFELNVERFARLGIPEYFAFDAPRDRLAGWRLREGVHRYEPIVPNGGRWWSDVLQLDLAVEHGRLRFSYGAATVLDAREWIERLSAMVDDALRRAEEQSQRAEAQAQRADDEAQRADRFERRLRELGIDPETVE